MRRTTLLNIFILFFVLSFSLIAQEPKYTEGSLIALNKSDCTITILSLETGEEIAVLGTGISPHEVAISPDGKTAVITNYGERPKSTLTVIDLEKRRPTQTIRLGEFIAPHGIEFHPDGKRIIATVERSKAVVIVNIEEGVVEQAIKTEELPCHMLSVTPDGKYVFASSIRGNAVAVIDLLMGKTIKTLKTGNGAEGIAVTPNGKEVWVTNRGDNTISIIDVSKLEIIKTINSKEFPIRIKFTPDGEHALVSNANSGDVAIFDAVNRTLIKKISMEVTASEDTEGRLFNQFGTSPAPIGILITADGSHAFIANTRADIITVIDLTKMKIKGRLATGKEPDGLGYSSISY